jgi:muconolactone delta-isomerase
MEFLVDFALTVPEGASESEITQRESAEAAAAANLVREGHLVRLWKAHAAQGEVKAVGLYRADNQAQLDRLLGALPLGGWMQIRVTRLEPHPNDPTSTRAGIFQLPNPRLTPVYRLDATVGEPLELGDRGQGHRRIVPLTGGTFTGPQISGTLVPGASADWQTVLPDGTAIGDIRYTLQTHRGDLLSIQARGVRHGPAEVLARLGHGEDVDPGEYTFRAATQIETAAPELDWAEQGRFHQRRRPRRRPRHLRNVPRRMNPAPDARRVAVITAVRIQPRACRWPACAGTSANRCRYAEPMPVGSGDA